LDIIEASMKSQISKYRFREMDLMNMSKRLHLATSISAWFGFTLFLYMREDHYGKAL
jgi:hypothetical protein